MTDAEFAAFVAALGLALVAGCTVYDPNPNALTTAPAAAQARSVRVCGEAVEFDLAERVLAATRLFASVKRCSDPPAGSDIVAHVSRPYYSDKDAYPTSLILMVLSVGVIPAVDCRHDLAFDFYLGGPPARVAPKRTTCALYGWLPPLLTPFTSFHFGRTADVEREAEVLRAAILTEQPAVAAAASPN